MISFDVYYLSTYVYSEIYTRTHRHEICAPWSYRCTRHVRMWAPISIICRRIGHWDLADPLDSTCDYSIHRPVKSTSARCVPRSFSLSLFTLPASFALLLSFSHFSFLSVRPPLSPLGGGVPFRSFPLLLLPLARPIDAHKLSFFSFRSFISSLFLSLSLSTFSPLFSVSRAVSLHDLAALGQGHRHGGTIRSNTLR